MNHQDKSWKLFFKITAVLLIMITGPHRASGQIENVIVEKYYVSDSLDATDTVMGRYIEPGSVTYRIYIDLAPGSKLRSIYGDQNHPIQIKSTAPFYNNILIPNASFGYLMNKSLFLSVPSMALDSWITIGWAAKNQAGLPKQLDTDGNYFAGSNNTGGAGLVPGGILTNSDTSAGIPLTVSDGMITDNTLMGTWVENGFRNFTSTDTTVFGPVNTGNEFLSYNSILQQANDVAGASPDSTIILVAQLTTRGEISFKLNVELSQFDGTNTTYVKYVSGSDSLQPGEIVSPLLSYPQECGCMNPDYFEYDPNFACNEPDSCRTIVRFGCTDSLACNYDPEANYNVTELCCYPGLCQDRDIALVCPDLNFRRIASVQSVYPNPANDKLNVIFTAYENIVVKHTVYNILGISVLRRTTGSVSAGQATDQLDISSLNEGLYILETELGDVKEIRKITVRK